MRFVGGRVARSLETFSRTFCFSKRYGGLLSWASAEGAKQAFLSLEIGSKIQKFLENLQSASWFWLIDLILAITLYTPVWHSHSTRASFTVLLWCSDELAVHSLSTLKLRQLMRFSSCDCWPQTSLAGDAARQWLLITVRHVVLYVWKEPGANL